MNTDRSPRRARPGGLAARYMAIIAYAGWTQALCGSLMLTSLAALFWRPEEAIHAPAFALPAFVLIAVGLALYRLLRPRTAVTLTVQEGGIVVLLGWSATVVMSTVPLMVVEHLNFTQAVFETVSGWTTTGLSVVNVEKAAWMTLLWRSTMQLAGGAGLAVIMLASITGQPGQGITGAEGKADQLVPNVRKSASLVVRIYLGYAVAGVLGYVAAGMTWFDAINHSFAAISTGGFSTRSANIGYWDSAAVEAVSIILMIVGNMSFITAWVILRGRFRTASKNCELRLMAVVLPVSAAIVLAVMASAYPTLGKGVRVAVFETVTSLTTTGFSTVGYYEWRPLAVLVLTVLMLIGAGTYSTGGGIKQFRVYLLSKSFVWDLRGALLPRGAVVEHPFWQGDDKVFLRESDLRRIGTFVFIYIAAWLVGAGVIAGCGFNLRDALFESASAVGTVGLSVGVTSPGLAPAALWTMSVQMFLGRLEFLVVFASLLKILRDVIAAFRSG